MTVQQTTEQQGPSALTIYFASPDQKVSSAVEASRAKDLKDQYAPLAGEGESSAVLDLKDLAYTEIWDRVKKVTGAKEVTSSEEDERDMQRFEEMKVQAEKDRIRVGTKRQKELDQKRQLEEAKREIERVNQLRQ